MHSLFTRLSARRRVRTTADMLSALSDAQLADAGIRRFDIPRHARDAARIAPPAAGPRHVPAAERMSYAG